MLSANSSFLEVAGTLKTRYNLSIMNFTTLLQDRHVADTAYRPK